MASGRNKAIPISPREYPDYVYREFPKIVGTVDVDGKVVPSGTKSKDGDNWIVLVARDKEHEAAIRREYTDLPVWVPPPSSLSMAEMKARMTELEQLRAENKRLKLQIGGVETAEPQLQSEPISTTPPVVETDRGPPGTDPALLAAGEDPNGDPWAKLPENDIPAPGKPPSIKGNSTPPQSNNKFKR